MTSLKTVVVVSALAALLAGAACAAPAVMVSPNLPGINLPELAAGTIYLATLNINPGVVLKVDGATETLVYTRPMNNLTSFTISKLLEPELAKKFPVLLTIYYANGLNEKRIYRIADNLVYTHKTYVREVAIGPDKALYFSESQGASGDGTIYRLDATLTTATVYYQVHIADIGGTWAGNFAFGKDGKLYVANGNTPGAAIWECPVAGGTPTSVYKDKGAILGFCFTDRQTFLFTNGTPDLMKASIGAAAAEIAFTSPKKNRYCDVAVR
jgi:hypothetical protein